MSESSKSWLEKLSDALIREPQDREQLIDVLRDAEHRELLNADALGMIESTLQLSEMRVRDILIPKSHMVFVTQNQSFEVLVKTASESGNSRFPVMDAEEEHVIGILLAKDLLSFVADASQFNIKDIMRSAKFVPESKRLDSLLREFRLTHNHMAVVVDEYGNVEGLVTIEDVLEQIVGDIEDEHDVEDDEDFIKKHADGRFILKAQTPIEDFNDYFQAKFPDDEYDTIGGLIVQKFGYLPKRGEETALAGFQFTVLHADNRRLRLLEMQIGQNVIK